MDRAEIERVVGELFESWYSFLVRYAARAIGSVEVAEDLVQEVFLRLWKELWRGKKIESPKGWTFQVLRHEISKSFESRLISLEDFDADDPPGRLQIEPDVENHLEVDQLTRWFSVLSRREEEVIVLRLASLKYREIGERLGMKTSTVETLLSRALRKLREVMGAGTPSEVRTGEHSSARS